MSHPRRPAESLARLAKHHTENNKGTWLYDHLKAILLAMARSSAFTTLSTTTAPTSPAAASQASPDELEGVQEEQKAIVQAASEVQLCVFELWERKTEQVLYL